MRYRSGGPVDLGYGLGTAPPLILRRGDRLDLMVGTDIWTMGGRDDRGLPCYGPPANAAIDENLGWSSVERRGQRRVAALRTADDGTPLELWSFASGDLRRYRVSYDAAWTFRPAGSASFPAPEASKGLGTVQLLSEGGSTTAPHLLLGDNDWRQTQPVPAQWNPDLPFPEDLRVRYLDGVWRGRDVTGRVYVARNEGGPDPRYHRLQTVHAGDPASPVLVDGRASPLLVRPFADGETHLFVADFRGGLYDYLLDAAAVAAQGPHRRVRPDRNGYPDLLCTMEDGYLYVAVNDGVAFAQPVRLRQERDVIKAGVLAVPTPVRSSTGRLDLYCGNASGEILHLRDTATDGAPEFAPPTVITAGGKPFRLVAGPSGSVQGPEELTWGYVGPTAAEWSQPGVPDLILGCITGQYWLLPGKRGEAGLQWREPVAMTCEGRPFVGTWRVRPSVADWNGDGAPELLTLDEHGRSARSAGCPPSPATRCTSAVPTAFPEFTFIGRSKLFAYDWDGDGLLELLIGTHCKLLPTHRELYRLTQEANIGAGVVLIDNTGTPEAPVWGPASAVVDKTGARCCSDATVCAPIVVDWNGSPTMIVGDRGRLPAPLRHGRAGSVPRHRTAA
ncbi:hypothetical protein GBAR_LOCUS9892 [Geodia barretti]|uniref:Uncharacterized protein n=1 Tax=Geodia barretti TaxID=519541 RepID=A0AA35RQW9_GEOBA|nr:hypothetical protein GBAR_LOCUS9892 [Geodia barretti]